MNNATSTFCPLFEDKTDLTFATDTRMRQTSIYLQRIMPLTAKLGQVYLNIIYYKVTRSISNVPSGRLLKYYNVTCCETDNYLNICLISSLGKPLNKKQQSRSKPFLYFELHTGYFTDRQTYRFTD